MSLVIDVIDLVTKHKSGELRCPATALITIYGHGSHLGHVTLIIYIHIDSPILYMLHMKFGFHWPSGFREEDV